MTTSKEFTLIKTMSPGQRWAEPHDCYYIGTDCPPYHRLLTAASYHWGVGRFRSTHSGGVIGITRRGVK